MWQASRNPQVFYQKYCADEFDPEIHVYNKGSLQAVGWIYNLGSQKINVYDTKVAMMGANDIKSRNSC